MVSNGVLEIDEERIKQILGSHGPRLLEIHNRILEIHNELLNADSLIESVSAKKVEWDREGSVKGGIKQDLSDVMLRHQKLARERELDLRGELYQLVYEEEAINRVWVCFRALRGKEYIFIEQLYVRGMPYKVAERESGVSHKTFEMYRRSGMNKILKTYQSELGNLEIAGRSDHFLTPKKQKAAETDAAKAPYTQLELKI